MRVGDTKLALKRSLSLLEALLEANGFLLRHSSFLPKTLSRLASTSTAFEGCAQLAVAGVGEIERLPRQAASRADKADHSAATDPFGPDEMVVLSAPWHGNSHLQMVITLFDPDISRPMSAYIRGKEAVAIRRTVEVNARYTQG